MLTSFLVWTFVVYFIFGTTFSFYVHTHHIYKNKGHFSYNVLGHEIKTNAFVFAYLHYMTVCMLWPLFMVKYIKSRKFTQ